MDAGYGSNIQFTCDCMIKIKNLIDDFNGNVKAPLKIITPVKSSEKSSEKVICSFFIPRIGTFVLLRHWLSQRDSDIWIIVCPLIHPDIGFRIKRG